MLRTTKPPKCRFCKKRTDGLPLHDACVQPWWDREREKKARRMERKLAEARRNEKRRDRARREEMKTLPDLHKEARYWFNRFIRLRDAEKPCISCGKPPPDMSGLHAGRDCGHFRSVGSAGHLRYTEDNAAAQCVHCNQYLAGNYTGFRKGQIERIGEARVVELENDNQPEKWLRDQVRGIRDEFKARCKELEKRAREAA